MNEGLDYSQLNRQINQKNTRLSYKKYASNFYKVAFDVFKSVDPNINNYWVLEKDSETGEEYLCATYEDEAQIESKSSWQALNDRSKENITLAYKDVPIKRFASSDWGFSRDDIQLFKKALLNKLSNSEFQTKLINSLSPEKLEYLKSKFPELS